MEFTPFPKVPRFSRDIIITEKLDGTNAAVVIAHQKDAGGALGPFVAVASGDLFIYAQSRTRMITPENDNFGFAAWVRDNADDLVNLGPGVHFGEWWGRGIQRGYGLRERRFSLFNVSLWGDGGSRERPTCCRVVPKLYEGPFTDGAVHDTMQHLQEHGSFAAPFMNPEGVMIFHTAAGQLFKKTFEHDTKGKEAA